MPPTRNTLRSMFIGSETQKVLAHPAIPVWVFRWEEK